MRAFTDEECRHFLRYTRTRHWPILQRHPVRAELHTELLAAMLASPPGRIAALLRALRDHAAAAAAEMLTDPAYAEAVAALPFRPGDRVVAVGDSITADRLGWFELLARSMRGPTLINLGVSGNTTADVLERFDRLEAARPSRVLLMLGTNDARAHGRRRPHRMATTAETARNLRALADLVTGELGAALTVITPPAVDQQRVDAFFGEAPLHWRADAVAEVAEAVRAVDPGAADLHAATRAARRPDLLEADGIHPSPAGQRFIAAHVVDHLRRAPVTAP